jgi:WD40 repeat protein
VTAGRFQTRLWDPASRQAVGEPLPGGWSIAVSPDSKLLASTDGVSKVRLWDIVSRPARALGDPLHSHSSVVTTVAFSPDGKILASGSYDHTVQLWDVLRRQPLGDSLRGHLGYVMSVAFSFDGKTLASASWDRTVMLWDVATRQPLGGPLNGQSGLVNSVAFSPNGKLLASATGNGVMLWDLDPNSWTARLCRLANRNLSLSEWSQFIGPNVPYHRTCPNLPDGEGVPRKQKATAATGSRQVRK